MYFEDREIDFILDLESLDSEIREKIDENKIRIIVAKVKRHTEESIDLKTNRNLVSFTEKSSIKKVVIEDIIMAFGFDGRLTFDDYALCCRESQFDSKSELSEIFKEEF